MTQNLRKPEIAILAAIIFACVGLQRMSISAKAADARVPVALPATDVVRAMQVSLDAHPGQILSIGSERHSGRQVCEVEILAKDGKIFDLFVDNETGHIESVQKLRQKTPCPEPQPRKALIKATPFRDYSQQSYRYWELF